MWLLHDFSIGLCINWEVPWGSTINGKERREEGKGKKREN
jgi:hypothetical protein